MKLRALAPAKVNLCLFLGPGRADGRHELVTLYESLTLHDELQLETLDVGPDRVICPEIQGGNLAAQALRALRATGWAGPPVEISIRKRIPVAAGMAGGSADAAAALRLAIELAPVRPDLLDVLAAELGSDVPAQLSPGLALGTGAGEVLERPSPLAPHALLVVPLPAELSTPAVYREADRLGLPRSSDELRDRHRRLRDALQPGARLPDELLVNDLQPAAVSLCPPVGEALTRVHEAGAPHVIVSGSGPTVVGLWWGADARAQAQRVAETLRSRYPRAQSAGPVDASAGRPHPV